MMSKRIFLSSDPGIDDMAAILFALADTEIELVGIGAVAGNVAMQTALENARFTCALAAPSRKVACYAGSRGPLLRDQIFGAHKALGSFRDNLKDLEDRLPAFEPAAVTPERSAAEAMADAIRHAAHKQDPLIIAVTGPMTDVALAMMLAGKAHCQAGIESIVAMGGAFKALGNRSPFAEMNMLSDPHAARIVCESGIPLVLFPLDVTWQCRLTREDLEQMEREAGVIGQVFSRLFRASDRENPALYGGPGGPVHDLLPIVWLVADALFTWRNARVSVATGPERAGHTSRLLQKSGDTEAISLPHRIVESVKRDAVLALFLDRLKALAHGANGVAACDHHNQTNREEDLQ
ncbi:nucleoside hydrolase [uncultured Cohaesibacter sp.]|uniref:nucleoside hydrolase n=1 Tax=uncultured Cohaesibacter sp. TaxID=1002546 RepID=UPI002AA7FAAE|nr:nucleoside hydrolase [uncultured Cohaesibacter sp.]